MSEIIVNKFWHLGTHEYIFYRFELETFCNQYFSKPGLVFLDAGCGNKISSLSHVPKDMFFVGIDISSKNVVDSHFNAKTKGYQTFGFVVASVTHLPFCNECFDLVLCCDVLEHVEAKQRTIQEISRVCKQQGTFVGSTTNIFNPIMFLDSLLPQIIMSVPVRKFSGDHYERHSRFTPKELLQSLSKAKFRKCKIKLLGFPPFRAAIYEFSNKKLPWYAFFWIIFDKLTNKKQLRLIKEIIAFFAQKE